MDGNADYFEMQDAQPPEFRPRATYTWLKKAPCFHDLGCVRDNGSQNCDPKVIILTKSVFTVGSGEGVDDGFIPSPTVAVSHCTFIRVIDTGKWRVQSNGPVTLINLFQKLAVDELAMIKSGDLIQIGSDVCFNFIFIDEENESDEHLAMNKALESFVRLKERLNQDNQEHLHDFETSHRTNQQNINEIGWSEGVLQVRRTILQNRLRDVEEALANLGDRREIIQRTTEIDEELLRIWNQEFDTKRVLLDIVFPKLLDMNFRAVNGRERSAEDISEFNNTLTRFLRAWSDLN